MDTCGSLRRQFLEAGGIYTNTAALGRLGLAVLPWSTEQFRAVAATETSLGSQVPSEGTGSVSWCQAEDYRNGSSAPSTVGNESKGDICLFVCGE